jgi:hypothetical protein
MKHAKYLKDNAGAVNVEFSEEDENNTRKATESVGGAKGARYSEAFLARCLVIPLNLVVIRAGVVEVLLAPRYQPWRSFPGNYARMNGAGKEGFAFV